MFITIIFIVLTTMMIVRKRKIEGNWVNLISILMAPYVILVFLNNFFIHRIGFYKVDDKVLLMLLFAFFMFYVGTSLFTLKKQSLNQEEDTEIKFSCYNIKRMTYYLYFVGIVGLIKLFTLYRSGQFSAVNINDAEGIMGNGIIGHLILSSYAVFPIVFLYWTYHKRAWFYLLPILMIAIITFSTFIKYNIVGLIVSSFLFVLVYRKSLLRYGVTALVSLVIFVFVGNYAITFAVHGADVEHTFYIGHFWTYACGSIIYDNYIFSSGIRVGVDIFYKLGTFFCALPNMFIEKTTGTKLFPHERQDDLSTGEFGEDSNVVDAFGYLFPSRGHLSEVILYGFVIFLIGAYFAYLYKKHMAKNKCFDTFITNFLCYFVFFSFFGTFYINSSPWEIIVYSLIIPKLFIRKVL